MRQAAPRLAERSTVVLFTATAFVGAAMLFVVQPMVAKLLLPSYGGSATVWSTSSVFFQVVLLLAYWYVHASTRRLGSRRQPRLHLLVLLVPVLALPVALPTDAAAPGDVSPVFWLLRTLVVMIGLPFAVLATTGPALQRWYSWTGSTRSEDPYFLFAASNFGSFCGLLAYPFLIEPHVSLAGQRTLWSWGFVLFAALTAACALRAGFRPSLPEATAPGSGATELGARRVATWLGLAFVPSSLMLGVTAHITTDVAAIPLLWVVPLALYLATFVVAFGRTSRVPPVAATRMATATALVVAVVAVAPGEVPITVHIALNLVLLAVVGVAAHGRLAADRPEPRTLTAYYLVISVGGALGGLLNGVVAPILFDRVLEYQIVVVAVPLLMLGLPAGRPSRSVESSPNPVRAVVVVLSTVLGALVVVGLAGQFATPLVIAGLASVAFLAGLWLSRAPVATVTALALAFAVPAVATRSQVLAQERSFYGSYRVTSDDGMHTVSHGTTVHGSQFREASRRRTPTTYYSRSGPVGDAFAVAGARAERVGVIGLGAGTLAAYGRSGQSMTFFEIDAGIVDLARDPRLFTYLGDSEADIETVVGDGRLSLAERDERFDVLVLDAFSSDSIPVHLLTREAMQIYRDRLSEDGLLLVHISNRVFGLEPVVATAADDLGWSAAVDHARSEEAGATASSWVVLSPDPRVVEALRARARWDPLDPPQRVRWTDDYSSVLAVLR